MLRTYEYRLYPSKKTTKILNNQLELCRHLYNNALTERKEAYRLSHISLNYKLQANELPAVKSENPEYNDIHSQVLQDVLNRLDKAFKNFFNRIKNKAKKGKKAGFPRYKSYGQYNSLTYTQSGFKLSNNYNKLSLSKIGLIKIIMHRELIGNIKTCTIKKDKVGDWFACFTCEFPDAVKKPLEEIKEQYIIGVDAGINKLAVLSNGINGVEIENPEILRKSEESIKIAQRELSRKKRGSKNRLNAKQRMAKRQRKLANARKDYLHKVASEIVKSGDIMVFEDLNVQGMVQNHNLAGRISYASWSKLVGNCIYKADDASKYVEFVNPNGTIQLCSRCGAVVRKALSERIHKCNNCGLEMDRDLNAALNIRERYIRLVWNSVKKPVDVLTPAQIDEQVGTTKQEAPMV